jgi:hypothetical protein
MIELPVNSTGVSGVTLDRSTDGEGNAVRLGSRLSDMVREYRRAHSMF